ncbi:hypothetical protein VNI00_000529 [Paramarasmius palmivorus]|uniref:Chromo domain-containing protein n=1 Tax=Paramarasmius palmivorus TaxID=297713 RepID=A0AAW0E5V5_9AGAR
MVRSVVSDSEEMEVTTSSKKNDKGRAKPAEEVESEGGEGDEEEYEIEAILNAKKGRFKANEWAYFVKWKGYDNPSDNSWVSESDAENARELIDRYWAKENAKKAPRKSESASVKRGRPRKSSVAESPEPSPAPKKRGRKSKADEADMSEEESKSEPASKKAKKGALSRLTQSTESGDEMDVDEGKIADARAMKKYMNLGSWENMVRTIDTVERPLNSGKDLTVYFRLTDEFGGERVKLVSSTCNAKFPQKMLAFYERHLKWKETEIEDD